MGNDCHDYVRTLGGVASREELLKVATDDAIEWAVSAGHLLRPWPRTFLLPELAGDLRAEREAALTYAGEGAALSHLTALAVWELPVPEAPGTHVLVHHDRRPRRGSRADEAGGLIGALTVHRSRRRPKILVRHGLPVVPVERAVIESWPLLSDDAARAPALVAVRQRRTTVSRLRGELRNHPRLPRRRELVELLDLIAAGCHSELELWGHSSVFVGREFSTFSRQRCLKVGGRTVYLDLFDEESLLDVELDGRRYHSGPRERERDIARDAALAELGIQTLRFSHERLVADPAGGRWQVLTIRQERLQQLRGRHLGTLRRAGGGSVRGGASPDRGGGMV